MLVVIFNEDYSKNVPTLEHIYKTRFASRAYVVPDHFSFLEQTYRRARVPIALLHTAESLGHWWRRSVRGRRNRHELIAGPETLPIWRVVGDKWHFQQFLWQIRRQLQGATADWYWFIGDDVLMQPGIDETTIESLLGLTAESKVVLCRPEVKPENWVSHFQGTVKRCDERLSRLGKRVSMVAGGSRALGAVRGGCSDFFGIRRDVLQTALDAFDASARLGLFVEIAVPWVLESLDPNPVYVDRYYWDFDADRGSAEKLARFWADEHAVFYHPCKLSNSHMARCVLERYAES